MSGVQLTKVTLKVGDHLRMKLYTLHFSSNTGKAVRPAPNLGTLNRLNHMIVHPSLDDMIESVHQVLAGLSGFESQLIY